MTHEKRANAILNEAFKIKKRAKKLLKNMETLMTQLNELSSEGGPKSISHYHKLEERLWKAHDALNTIMD